MGLFVEMINSFSFNNYYNRRREMLKLAWLVATANALQLAYEFSVEQTECEVRVKWRDTVVFESDSEAIQVGYGLIDQSSVVINGQVGQMP